MLCRSWEGRGGIYFLLMQSRCKLNTVLKKNLKDKMVPSDQNKENGAKQLRKAARSKRKAACIALSRSGQGAEFSELPVHLI